MYDIEKFYEAKSAEDAVAHLAADPNAMVISGGTDVLVKLRSGKGAGCDLVSVHEIPELRGVDRTLDGTIVIGPATCFTDITNDPVIRESLPYLGEAVDTVGGPQIRNMGTIGGNLCNGATSADSAATMQTLNAVLVLQGPDGSREVPVTEFYTGPGRTVRRREEVLIAILIRPEDYIGWSGCYIKYGKRKSMEIATLGCCVRVKLEADPEGETFAEAASGKAISAEAASAEGTIKRLPGAGFILGDVRIGYAVAAPTPIRCRNTENLLKGMRADDPKIYELIAEQVLKEVSPRNSWRASLDFRIQLIKEMAKRALEQAILRGTGHGTPGASYFAPVELDELGEAGGQVWQAEHPGEKEMPVYEKDGEILDGETDELIEKGDAESGGNCNSAKPDVEKGGDQ